MMYISKKNGDKHEGIGLLLVVVFKSFFLEKQKTRLLYRIWEV